MNLVKRYLIVTTKLLIALTCLTSFTEQIHQSEPVKTKSKENQIYTNNLDCWQKPDGCRPDRDSSHSTKCITLKAGPHGDLDRLICISSKNENDSINHRIQSIVGSSDKKFNYLDSISTAIGNNDLNLIKRNTNKQATINEIVSKVGETLENDENFARWIIREQEASLAMARAKVDHNRNELNGPSNENEAETGNGGGSSDVNNDELGQENGIESKSGMGGDQLEQELGYEQETLEERRSLPVIRDSRDAKSGEQLEFNGAGRSSTNFGLPPQVVDKNQIDLANYYRNGKIYSKHINGKTFGDDLKNRPGGIAKGKFLNHNRYKSMQGPRSLPVVSLKGRTIRLHRSDSNESLSSSSDNQMMSSQLESTLTTLTPLLLDGGASDLIFPKDYSSFHQQNTYTIDADGAKIRLLSTGPAEGPNKEQQGQQNGAELQQEVLGCQRKFYTFRATKSDKFGNKCSGLVTSSICYGSCDTGQFSDHVFPYRKTVHKVCTHGLKIKRQVALPECFKSLNNDEYDDDQLSSLRVYKYVDAGDCVCKSCNSIDTTCLGSTSRPYLPKNTPVDWL